MVRGIEKRQIFEDDQDREDFLHRLGKVLEQCQASCFAWTLIPNHVHILLRTGPVPLGKMMRRLLTGYAVRFNRRHQRSGHLFQNRYRSLVCEEELYLLELVRYIHLNAIRAGLVKDIGQLDRYRWSGHSVLMGRQKRGWQAREEVLSHFDEREEMGKRRYRQFICEGMRVGKRNDFVPEDANAYGETTDGKRSSDPRILGCDSFVEKILSSVGPSGRHPLILKRRQIELEGLIHFIAKALGVTSEEIKGGSRRRGISKARAALCYVCMTQFGVTGKELSQALEMSPTAIYLASVGGEAFVNQAGHFQKSLHRYLNNLSASP